jgi:hypothetical protein
MESIQKLYKLAYLQRNKENEMSKKWLVLRFIVDSVFVAVGFYFFGLGGIAFMFFCTAWNFIDGYRT